jgi:hypothetical protein
MRKIFISQKKAKSLNKWHSVAERIDYTACLKNAVNFLAA